MTSRTITLIPDDVHHGPLGTEDVCFRFEELSGGCLALVNLYQNEGVDSGINAFAWYIAGMDLAVKLNERSRELMSMIGPEAWRAIGSADAKFFRYEELVRQHPSGTAYLAGLNTDAVACDYFKIKPSNRLQTRQDLGQSGKVVIFDSKDCQWSA